MSEKIFEHETAEQITREQAATRLRELADAIEKQNEVRVASGDRDVTVDVADTVTYEYEIEVKEGGRAEIEVSLTW